MSLFSLRTTLLLLLTHVTFLLTISFIRISTADASGVSDVGVFQTENADEPVLIKGRIANTVPSSFYPSMRVVLNGGEYTTLVRESGSFQFPNGIPPNVYTLDVLSTNFLFSSYKLDARTPDRIRALAYHHPGAERESVIYHSFGLTVEPLLPPQYFTPRPSINWAGMLKNPMVLLMGFMALMMFGMPMMMGAMDEEEMKKMQAQYAEQSAGNDPSELLNGLFGGGNKDDSDDEE